MRWRAGSRSAPTACWSAGWPQPTRLWQVGGRPGPRASRWYWSGRWTCVAPGRTRGGLRRPPLRSGPRPTDASGEVGERTSSAVIRCSRRDACRRGGRGSGERPRRMCSRSRIPCESDRPPEWMRRSSARAFPSIARWRRSVSLGGPRAAAAPPSSNATERCSKRSDAVLARGFAWARARGDEALIGVPGVGRSMLTGCAPLRIGEGRVVPGGARRPGGRGRATDRGELRSGARGVEVPGAGTGAPAAASRRSSPIGGLGAPAEAAGTIAFLRLAERVLAWTGEVESLRKLRRLGVLVRWPSSRRSRRTR